MNEDQKDNSGQGGTSPPEAHGAVAQRSEAVRRRQQPGITGIVVSEQAGLPGRLGPNLGKGPFIHPTAVIGDGVLIGEGTVIGPGCVIGFSGFAAEPAADGSCYEMLETPHGVVIGENCWIGPGCVIDGGKDRPTVIGDGTKIDSQCKIAHDVEIGQHCTIAAQCGFAGHVIVHDYNQFMGQCGVRNFVVIGRGNWFAAKSGVMRNVTALPGRKYGGHPARELGAWMRSVIAIGKLPAMMRAAAKRRKSA